MHPSPSRRHVLRFAALGALTPAALGQNPDSVEHEELDRMLLTSAWAPMPVLVIIDPMSKQLRRYREEQWTILHRDPGSALVPLALCNRIALQEQYLPHIGVNLKPGEAPPWAVLLLTNHPPELLVNVKADKDLEFRLSKLVLGRNRLKSWRRFRPTEASGHPKELEERELNAFRRGFIEKLRRLALDYDTPEVQTKARVQAMARIEADVPGICWVDGPARHSCSGGPCGTAMAGPASLRFLGHFLSGR